MFARADKENQFTTPVKPTLVLHVSGASVSPHGDGKPIRLHPYYRSPLNRTPIPFNITSSPRALAHNSPPWLSQPYVSNTGLASPFRLRSGSLTALAGSNVFNDFTFSHEGADWNAGNPPDPDTLKLASAIENGLEAIATANEVAERASECGSDPDPAVSNPNTVLCDQEKEDKENITEATTSPELIGGDLPWEEGMSDFTMNLFRETFVPGETSPPLTAEDRTDRCDGRAGRVLDEEYLTSCRFYHHDPRRPLPTNLDILFRVCNYFGPGVSRSELRQAFRRCKACRRFMYTDARGSHQCNAAPLSLEGQDLASAFLSVEESSGLSSQELRTQLTICGLCDHVLQSKVLNSSMHTCAAA
ncbi:hypothetical protein NMY22_g18157 [Coprinellus aureogranulatus]|nr:hypothetical protein NMY22_g18157 [Coprinellus aureogranulatus]